MVRYIMRRLMMLPFLLLLFSVLIFIIIQAPPGDFLSSYIAQLAATGSSVSTQQAEALRAQYGLDRSVVEQYFLWLGNVLQGNLGVSMEYRQPVADLILARLGPTVILALFALVFTWALALPLGIIGAVKQHTVIDYVFTVFSYIGVATPNFLIALVFMWWAFSAFGVNLSGLNSQEFQDAPWDLARILDFLNHLWIPMIILGLDGTARLARIMRANLLDELNKPYVEAARTRGLSEYQVILKYPVRMALSPLVSTIGWYLPQLFSGSLILATVMNLPNIGPLLLRALTNQDMFLAGSILLVYSLLTIIGTLISDILLAWLDPRIQLDRAAA
ncbi:MAG: ABC transporter permease [Anaerolineae bacterium]